MHKRRQAEPATSVFHPEQAMDAASAGNDIYKRIAELYPICRSITGPGLRETLAIVGRHLPLELHEVATGTRVFDWTVPKEWSIRDAYVKNERGDRVIDFRRSNLHVVGYSVPVRARLTLAELTPHLFTIPERPDWVPYRTSYYKEQWGFCLSHREFEALEDVGYEVCIDSSLDDGHLTYGECCLPGESDEEVLISCHACHPSMCNDNLSGLALATVLAETLQMFSLRYTYRFLFIPATIGSITWLAQNESGLDRIRHGLVLACLGDPGEMTYKRSRHGSAEIDRVVAHVLQRSGRSYSLADFSPWGYDERQFCSPGINLPVGLLSRTPHGRFPEYHTSADNLDYVRPDALGDSFARCLAIVYALERNRRYLNTHPKCEPQLGRRGLYAALGGRTDSRTSELAMLWLLNFSDGEHTLLDIAERADMGVEVLAAAADRLVAHELLKPLTVPSPAGRPAASPQVGQR